MADNARGPHALTVLFICTGNMHRSPLAERLLAARLPEAQVLSAGTRAQYTAAMDPATRSVLETLGGSGAGFASTPLTADLVAGADLVLGLEREHRDAAVRLWPFALRHCFTLKEFLRLAGARNACAATPAELIDGAQALRGSLPPVPRAADEIEDPWGASYDVLRECAGEIEAAVTDLADLLRCQQGGQEGRVHERKAGTGGCCPGQSPHDG